MNFTLLKENQNKNANIRNSLVLTFVRQEDKRVCC